MNPVEVMRHYFVTEMTRDVDAIMRCYAEDAIFTSPEAVRRGWAEIRPFYEDAVRRFPSLDVEVVLAFSEGPHATAEWSAVLTGPDGATLPLRGVNVARVERGLIVDVRSYYDAGSYAEAT